MPVPFTFVALVYLVLSFIDRSRRRSTMPKCLKKPKCNLPVQPASTNFLLARLVANLLQLAHSPLLASITNKANAVHAQLLALAVAVHEENDH